MNKHTKVRLETQVQNIDADLALISDSDAFMLHKTSDCNRCKSKHKQTTIRKPGWRARSNFRSEQESPEMEMETETETESESESRQAAGSSPGQRAGQIDLSGTKSAQVRRTPPQQSGQEWVWRSCLKADWVIDYSWEQQASLMTLMRTGS